MSLPETASLKQPQQLCLDDETLATKLGCYATLCFSSSASCVPQPRPRDLQITELGSEAIVVGASVGKREDIDRLFKEVTDKWGRVDVLVNNAGEPRQGWAGWLG